MDQGDPLAASPALRHWRKASRVTACGSESWRASVGGGGGHAACGSGSAPKHAVSYMDGRVAVMSCAIARLIDAVNAVDRHRQHAERKLQPSDYVRKIPRKTNVLTPAPHAGSSLRLPPWEAGKDALRRLPSPLAGRPRGLLGRAGAGHPLAPAAAEDPG